MTIVSVCASVPSSGCPSVTVRYSTKTAKRGITQSCKQRRTIAQDSCFLTSKIVMKFKMGLPNGAKCRWGTLKSAILDRYLVISQKQYKIGS